MFGGFTIFHRTCLGAFLRFTGCKALDFWSAGIPKVAGGMICMKHQNGVWEH